jgi:virginiamycin B lyase
VSINEYAVPTQPSVSRSIVSGPDGNLWFTELLGNKIGQINPTTHAVSEFPNASGGTGPEVITAGPDGNLWFTDDSNKIGEINPTTHVVMEFPIPTSSSEPEDITAGPDGNLWFTEVLGKKIGQINPMTHAIAEFALPSAAHGPAIHGITTGPDGSLWFTDESNDMIGQINPTTHVINEFAVPTSGSGPLGITTGPDNNLWFAENQGNQIGELNPTTGAFSEFPLPTSRSNPNRITTGPDGNLWFTESNGDKIAQINPTSHAIAEFSVPSVGAAPEGITSGPDHNLWFGEGGEFSGIGQVVLGPAAAAPDLALSGTAPMSATVGTNLTYTLTVTNDGTGNATGVTLLDTLPPGVTFVSATGGATPNTRGQLSQLSLTIGNLAAGANSTVNIVVTPTMPGMLSNRASAYSDQTDPTPADDSVVLSTSVLSATADVALSGIVPAVVIGTTNVTFTLTVTSDGAAQATGVTLTDMLDPGLTFVSATGTFTRAGNTLTFTIGNLAPGASASVSISANFTSGVFMATDLATVTFSQTDPTPADNSKSLYTTYVPLPPTTTTPTTPGTGMTGMCGFISEVILRFAEPIDAAWAQNPNNYHIAPLTGPHRTIRLKSAVYDEATHTVTLKPLHAFNVANLYRLTVMNAALHGVGAPVVRPAHPNLVSDPGGNLVIILRASELEVNYRMPQNLHDLDNILKHQRAELKRLGLR